MSISTISSSIARLQKELADIAHKTSLEAKKEADCASRISQIERSIGKNISESSLRSKRSEIERKIKEIAQIQVKKADLAKKNANTTEKLLKLKQDLAKEEEKERKKQVAADEKERKKIIELEKKQRKEQLDFQKKLQQEINATTKLSKIAKSAPALYNIVPASYDLFISHASEDKEEFVRPLADTLQNLGVKVWYDEFTLRVGDSLRRSGRDLDELKSDLR